MERIKPNWEVSEAISSARKTVKALEKYGKELEPRLPAGAVDGLKAELESHPQPLGRVEEGPVDHLGAALQRQPPGEAVGGKALQRRRRVRNRVEDRIEHRDLLDLVPAEQVNLGLDPL